MATYCQGTVHPAGADFDKDKSATWMRKAMKGLGTDERAIIDVLTMHSNTERQEIKEHYKQSYGRDLVEDLESDLCGHFETLCTYLLTPSRQFDAECIHKAMEGIGTDKATLVEILCARSNREIEQIKDEYRQMYDHDIEEDLDDEIKVSGDFKRVLVSLLQASRSEVEHVDDEQVTKDANDLYDAGEGNRWGTDESVFNKILVNRSTAHLRALMEAYKKRDEKGLEGAIISETSGDLQKAYLAIVRYIIDAIDYFATCFEETMKGPGTNDQRLMQLVVHHSEIDLKDIAEAYEKKYGKTLVERIKEDTSGDYGKLLVRLVKDNRAPDYSRSFEQQLYAKTQQTEA